MKQTSRKNALLIIFFCLALTLIIPTISAAYHGDNQRMNHLFTVPDLNITNDSFTNRTIPDRFQKSPEPVNVQIEMDETQLPAPKGEMALGPRKIGFSTSPALFAGLIIAACLVVTGAWLAFKKKQDDEKKG